MYFALVGLTLLIFITWWAYSIVYNLYFHPLAKVPGPRLAAASQWYAIYYDIVSRGGGQYAFKVKEFHERYGPIIRVTPDEVHISDPDFLSTIYATRDRNSIVGGGIMQDQSVHLANDYHLHKMRREALNPFFSTKAVSDMEPKLANKAAQLRSVVQGYRASQQPLNVSDMFFAYSNDMLRMYCFGSDDNLLSDLEQAKRLREDQAALLKGVNIAGHFTAVFRALSSAVARVLGPQALPPAMREIMLFRSNVRKLIEYVLADTKNDGKSGRRSVFYELRDSAILPQHEKTVDRLQDEATLFVLAGTESPAKTLLIASFYLAAQPSLMQRLRAELQEAKRHVRDADLPLSTLLALKYMQAVIMEANRLSLGVSYRMKRTVPHESVTYTASSGPHKGEDYVIPPNTEMSTLTWCTHTNEELFPDPLRFDPERWLGDDEIVNKRKRCMHSFGKGHRRCLGLNLANAEMSLAMAVIAQYDLELFESNESEVSFKYDFQVPHPPHGSKGVRVVVKGEKDL
ncbi:hypothetical protein LTR78_009019 [Recurvomyces mirabilis]|uniref:Cytochrome P450 n=1 Tax=Recurvomyces mirabilis TaxID=574656 RepID=A0AAE0TSY2_9PEZI|nr:hypothetical protein LTR78_009019 [Recurvomyces mirabilis]KAK5150454.1 hypothetical protein LTS14_010144 [Recurvomyces mirabilis]